jgi:UDP-3-O-acyl-N-acetylglucosamine deacetylase
MTDGSALSKQVDGSHYKDMTIQPVIYIYANNIPFIEGNIIKYVSRWKKKNGIKDLEKAKHLIDVLIEFESSKSQSK